MIKVQDFARRLEEGLFKIARTKVGPITLVNLFVSLCRSTLLCICLITFICMCTTFLIPGKRKKKPGQILTLEVCFLGGLHQFEYFRATSTDSNKE